MSQIQTQTTKYISDLLSSVLFISQNFFGTLKFYLQWLIMILV